MWKVVAFVLVLALVGHLAIRYLRQNPLHPTVEVHQVVVTSQDYEMHFAQRGPSAGTYFVAAAETRDYSSSPVNAILWVIGADAARDYMRGYPDFHLYGSETSERLRNVAQPLGVVAATSASYDDLQRLLEAHEARSGGHGERLCVTVSGTALSPDTAISLETGNEDTGAAGRLLGDTPVVFAQSLERGDCVKLLAAQPR